MKFISLIIKILIVLVFFVISINNLQVVPFFYLPGQQIDLPLIIILFGFFVVGAVFGIFSMFGRLLSLRNENNRLRREVEKNAKMNAQSIAAPKPLPHDAAAPATTEKVQTK